MLSLSSLQHRGEKAVGPMLRWECAEESVGGEGVISVVGNIVPRDMLAMVKEYLAGNVAAAMKWHHKLFPLCRDMLGLATNPIPIKTALSLMSKCTGELRLPLTPMSEGNLKKLKQTMTEFGLLSTRWH